MMGFVRDEVREDVTNVQRQLQTYPLSTAGPGWRRAQSMEHAPGAARAALVRSVELLKSPLNQDWSGKPRPQMSQMTRMR